MAEEVMKPIMLTEEQVKTLEGLEESMRWLSVEIARAVRAGIDMSDQQANYERLRRLREGLLAVYTPEK